MPFLHLTSRHYLNYKSGTKQKVIMLFMFQRNWRMDLNALKWDRLTPTGKLLSTLDSPTLPIANDSTFASTDKSLGIWVAKSVKCTTKKRRGVTRLKMSPDGRFLLKVFIKKE